MFCLGVIGAGKADARASSYFDAYMSNRVAALRSLSGDDSLSLYFSGTVAQSVGGLRRSTGRLDQAFLSALSALHGLQRKLSAYTLQMIHGMGMSSLLVIVRYLIQQHPKLLDHPLFCGELSRLGLALQTAGYGPLAYEKGYILET